MNKNYIKYLIKTIYKSTAIRIIMALSFVIPLVSFIPIILNSDKSFNDMNTYLFLIIPFIFMVMFIIVVSIILFKDHEEDGTDIKIISYGISKRNMVLYKFAVVASSIVFYQLVSIFTFIIILHTDVNMSEINRIKTISSITIASIIIQLFFFALIQLFLYKFNRVISMMLTATIAFVFPVISLIMTPSLNASPRSVKDLNNPRYVLSSDNNFSLDTNQIYFDSYGSDIEAEINEWKESNSYEALAYADVWYHYTSMFNMFNSHDSYNSEIIQNWKKRIIKLKSAMSIDGRYTTNFWMSMNKDEISKSNFDYDRDVLRSTENIKTFFNNNPNYKNAFDHQASFLDRLYFLQLFSNNHSIDETNTNAMDQILKILEHRETKLDRMAGFLQIQATTGFLYKHLTDEGVITDKPATAINGFPINDIYAVGDYFLTNQNVISFAPEPYVPLWLIIFIWTSLTTSLLLISVYLYSKKEIK